MMHCQQRWTPNFYSDFFTSCSLYHLQVPTSSCPVSSSRSYCKYKAQLLLNISISPPSSHPIRLRKNQLPIYDRDKFTHHDFVILIRMREAQDTGGQEGPAAVPCCVRQSALVGGLLIIGSDFQHGGFAFETQEGGKITERP